MICDFCHLEEGVVEMVGSLGEDGSFIEFSACLSQNCRTNCLKTLNWTHFSLDKGLLKVIGLKNEGYFRSI